MNLTQAITQNIGTLKNRKMLRAVLTDCLRNDSANVNVMLAIFDDGIIEFARAHEGAPELEWDNYTRRVAYERALIEEKTKWGVKEWRKILTPQCLNAFKNLQDNPGITSENSSENSRRNGKTHSLEFDKYYINPTTDETAKRIYIPCGVGKTDKGFFIHGIHRSTLCNHASSNVYALVYNLLTRNSRIANSDIPGFLADDYDEYSIDYKSVFRASILILQLIRHNHVASSGYDINLRLITADDKIAFEKGVALINYYAAMFSKVIKTQAPRLKLHFTNTGKSMSVIEKADIYTENNTEIESNAREIWFGKKINYRLTRDDRNAVEDILHCISPFEGFKEGQYSALCDMLSTKGHAVCIMPTGSGKSLIYYLASILQPLPLIVIAPTEILIEDQLRNLKKFHHIDNAAHLYISEHTQVANYSIHNSLVYVTPMTLQNHFLHVKLKHINNGTKSKGTEAVTISPGPLVSYIVLDEIHCLSNWGHDFRPEYLMLSKALNKYLDRVSFWGFTATANYSVAEDIQRQLEIPQENFYSPIPFDKYNISYDFRCASNEADMFEILSEITSEIISERQRTLVFTKDDEMSGKIAEKIGYEADVFSSDAPETYYQFADENCLILVASEELGVGINFPNVQNIIHFGLPLSKNEYVQEIGRAGRENEKVTSYVIYLDNVPENIPEDLLQRDTGMKDIPQLLKGVDNDYGDVYRKLTDNCPTSEVLLSTIIKTYEYMNRNFQSLYTMYVELEELENIKKQLYILYILGYVNDWYTLGWNVQHQKFAIQIDICNSEREKYENHPEAMMRRMQHRLVEYFNFMHEEREHIAKASRANTPSALIKVYVEWYYNKFLYQHNEQFLDLFEFITDNRNGDINAINSVIKDYFGLPFLKMRSDEAYFDDLPMSGIVEKIIIGIESTTVTNIERINSNRYSYRLDYMLLCAHLRYRKVLDVDRLKRIIERTPSSEQKYINEGLIKLYPVCCAEAKLRILNYLRSSRNVLGISMDDFMKTVYQDGTKDIIYYAILSQRMNKVLV